MIITKENVRELLDITPSIMGWDDLCIVEVDGKEYAYNAAHPYYDDGVSYFHAIELGVEYDGLGVEIAYPAIYPEPECPNEWGDIYDIESPYIR